MKKGTKLYSIISGKCPRCHEGKFFKFKATFNPKKLLRYTTDTSLANKDICESLLSTFVLCM